MGPADVDQFIASSDFQKLPRGYQAMIEQQRQAAVQAATVARSNSFAAPLALAAKGLLFEMVLRAPGALPAPEPACTCPVHGEVPA